MSDWEKLFRERLAKTAGFNSLYAHSMGVAQIASVILERFGGRYPPHKRDDLIAASFFHDLGKLDPQFQAFLVAAGEGSTPPGLRVKHEANTTNYEALMRDCLVEVLANVQETIGYRFAHTPDVDTLLAFAVTHHGLFYLSIEMGSNGLPRRSARRQSTVYVPQELDRTTLADLLFQYHPFGGLVIAADLMGSFCQQYGVDWHRTASRASSLPELYGTLRDQRGPVESELKRERREHDLQGLLSLLCGRGEPG